MTEPVHHPALLLIAHGSSDPGWAEPFVKLQSVIRRRDPGQIVELAFMERMSPSFDDAVATLQARGIRQITVAPIFLAIGGHMRKDLPNLIGDAHQRTGIEFRVLPAIGEVDALIESIANWVLAART
jgi:sirohydrochlorin cobaltochelatase